ncbi:hypothetical protein [Plantactinospora soyae]|uniref:Uncharacterized protein n=1 Tax=Plantactinospora soyae TaxID=1544732 RepID=A0A927M2J7_9ACTN|nr:hypothetical protein [Plantactinospora soyae]MBE1485591.1 hypothetical protein [Plantactinospora soyae]
MVQLMPVDYQPPIRRSGSAGGDSGELLAACTTARENPGQWVWFDPRFLGKAPTFWVSEVNRGEKKGFREGEIWEATYEKTGQQNEEGHDEYRKMIRLAA